MEVGDENSPRATGLSSVSGKAKAKPAREPSGFPLAERSRDGQVIGPAPPLRQKGSGGEVADAKGEQSRRKSKSSRRLTADSNILADLMMNLDSPEMDENGEAHSTYSSKSKKKRRHKRRRTTAEFSAIDALLNDCSPAGDASPVVALPPMDVGCETAGSSSEESRLRGHEMDDVHSEGAVGDRSLECSLSKFAEGIGTDDTADFSSLFPPAEVETPKAFSDGKRYCVEEKAAAPRPRVRHHSNQKPPQSDVDTWAHVLPCPPSTSSAHGGGLSGADVGGEGGVKETEGPVSVKPQSPARRPKRSISLDPHHGSRRHSWDEDVSLESDISSAGDGGDALSMEDGLGSAEGERQAVSSRNCRDGDGSSVCRSDVGEAKRDEGEDSMEFEHRKESKQSDRRQTADFASLQELLSPLAAAQNRNTSSGFYVDVGVSSPAAAAECEGSGDDSGGHTADLNDLYDMMSYQDANNNSTSMDISPARSEAEVPVGVGRGYDVGGRGLGTSNGGTKGSVGAKISGTGVAFSPGIDSNATAQSDCVLRLLESTPSSGEEKSDLDQSVAEDSSPKVQETLATVGKGYGAAAAEARPDPMVRRQTCERGEFEGIIDDLTSSDGRRFEESPFPSSGISIDARSVLESSNSSPSFSDGTPSQSALFPQKDYVQRLGKERGKGDEEKKLKRRFTASPSALNSLMKDLASNAQAVSGSSGKMPSQDPRVTADTGESVGGRHATSSVVRKTSDLSRGDAEDSSPKAKTPSPPKNPTSAQEIVSSYPMVAFERRNSQAVSLAKRRETCERGEFECIIDDLTTSDGGIDEDSSSSSGISIDARSVLESSNSSPSSSMGTPSQSALFPPEDNVTQLAKEKQKENGRKKLERCSTASPSALNSLMKDLGSNEQAVSGASGKDPRVTAVKRESVKGRHATSSAVRKTSNVSRGDKDNSSPKAKTPSPRMARRARSKSPTSAQKEVLSASPRIPPEKRTSQDVSPPPKPSNRNPLPPQHPESTRGPLKSCLSSKKRARGPHSGDGDAFGVGNSGTPNQGILSMFGSPPATGARFGSGMGEVKTPGPVGAGGASAGEVVMETPRRVVFGDPMAAEFNHSSPSNKLTPMPSRAAKSRFPVERPEGEDTEEDEDEETVANTAHLAEWEDMDASSQGLDFSSFDSCNGFMDAEPDETPLSSSSGRRKRRDSLAPKSPLRRSIAAFSEDVRAAPTAAESNRFPDEPDSDSDVDSETRAVKNLNASISGRVAAGMSAAATATTAAQGPDAQNLSFSITTSQMHGIPDSESSMELTGTFGSPIEKVASSPSPAVNSRKGEAEAGLRMGCVSADTEGFLGVMTGKGDNAGQDADADDSRMDLNDSSELADPLCGLSLRDATSSPSTRRVSTGSLLDLVSEVGEIEKEVLSQKDENSPIQQEQQEIGDEMKIGDDSMDLLSPLTGAGAVAPRQSLTPSAGSESADARVDKETGNAVARWSSVFTQSEGKKLATVHEEMSPGRASSNSCPSPTLSLGMSLATFDEECVIAASSSSAVAQAPGVLRSAYDSQRESRESTGELPSAVADFEQELAAATAAAVAAVSAARGNGGNGMRRSRSGMMRDSVSGGEPTVDLPACVDFDAVGGYGKGRACDDDSMSTDGASASLRLSTSSKVGRKRESVSGGEPTVDLPACVDFDAVGGYGKGRACDDGSMSTDGGSASLRLSTSSKVGRKRESVSGGEPTVDLPACVDFDAVGGYGKGRACDDGSMSTDGGSASLRLSTSSKVGRKRESVSGGEPTVDLPACVDFDAVAGDNDASELTARRRSSIADVEMEVVDGQDKDGDNGVSSDPTSSDGSGSRRRLSSAAGTAESEPASLRRRESFDGQGSAGDDVHDTSSGVVHGKSASRNIRMNHESAVVGETSSAIAVSAEEASVAGTTTASRVQAGAVGAAVRPPLVRRASSASAYVGKDGQPGMLPRRRASEQQPLAMAKDKRHWSVASDPLTKAVDGRQEFSSAGSASGPEIGTADKDGEGDSSGEEAFSNNSNGSLSEEQLGECPVNEASAASGSAAAMDMDSLASEAAVDDAGARRHPPSRVYRRVSSALEVRGAGSGGENRRRKTLQTFVGPRRRVSLAPASATVGNDVAGKGSSPEGDSGGHPRGNRERIFGDPRFDGRSNSRRQFSVGSSDLRKRLSSLSDTSDVSRQVYSPPQAEELVENRAVGERVRGSEAEESSFDAELEGHETSSPLAMNVEDLIRFVSPDCDNGNAITSIIVSPETTAAARGVSFLRKDWRGFPDGLLHALASTLDSAAVEMEDTIAVVREHAEASADAVWKAHTDAPILAEIDHAIAIGHDQGTNVGMTTRLREMAKEIEGGLQRQWKGWELHVLGQLNVEAERAVSHVSKTGSALATTTNQIREMVLQTERANQIVAREKSLGDIRSRVADEKNMLERERCDIGSLEEELEALRREERDLASKKASLKEGQVRRKERVNAAERRRVSVVKLMELENESIGLEKEAREWDDKFQAQLGLKLWCQPFKLFPNEVILGYTMPHDSTVKHQLNFDLSGYPMVKAKVATFRDTNVFKSTPAMVGNPGSASDRLSRIMFEGNFGLFSGGKGDSKPGAVISGLQRVKSVKEMKEQLRIMDWYVGRACSLLREVHDLEKKYACTVVQDHGFFNLPFAEATLCVEVANWKTRTMLRLRFRVATSLACCVGPPEVEVDVGAVNVAMVSAAIREAGGHQAGVWMVAKAVRAAAACIDDE